MKIKIIKPLNKSGYFTNDVLVINSDDLDAISFDNEVEIIDEIETATLKNNTESAVQPSKKPTRKRKPKNECKAK